MITGLWMDEEEGAQRLVIELDDGDGDLLLVDLNYDPPTTESIASLETWEGWVEMAPRDPDAAPDPKAQLQVKLDKVREIMDDAFVGSTVYETTYHRVRKVLDS